MSTSDQKVEFWLIPGDICPRCRRPCRLPVAIAGKFPTVVVRYICERCRLVSDISWNIGEWETHFEDRFIREDEGLESHPLPLPDGSDVMPFPAGPSALFEDQARARRSSS